MQFNDQQTYIYIKWSYISYYLLLINVWFCQFKSSWYNIFIYKLMRLCNMKFLICTNWLHMCIYKKITFYYFHFGSPSPKGIYKNILPPPSNSVELYYIMIFIDYWINRICLHNRRFHEQSIITSASSGCCNNLRRKLQNPYVLNKSHCPLSILHQTIIKII